MRAVLLIAVGGAAGAVLRYWVSTGVYAALGRSFPYGTLAVNVLGSGIMGFLYVLLLERITVAAEWRAVLLVGLLGAFTTFSTFSIETLGLVEEGEPLRALVNIGTNVVMCLFAVWMGVVLGRQL